MVLPGRHRSTSRADQKEVVPGRHPVPRDHRRPSPLDDRGRGDDRRRSVSSLPEFPGRQRRGLQVRPPGGRLADHAPLHSRRSSPRRHRPRSPPPVRPPRLRPLGPVPAVPALHQHRLVHAHPHGDADQSGPSTASHQASDDHHQAGLHHGHHQAFDHHHQTGSTTTTTRAPPPTTTTPPTTTEPPTTTTEPPTTTTEPPTTTTEPPTTTTTSTDPVVSITLPHRLRGGPGRCVRPGADRRPGRVRPGGSGPPVATVHGPES